MNISTHWAVACRYLQICTCKLLYILYKLSDDELFQLIFLMGLLHHIKVINFRKQHTWLEIALP